MQFEEFSIDVLYKMLLKVVMEDGVLIKPRGLPCYELRFTQSILYDPRSRLIQNPARKLSLPFQLAEFIWIMGGDNSLEMISAYNKNYANFSDDGKVLHGAYGPRLRNWHGFDQLENCIQRLKVDPDSRQATMIIMNPELDFIEKTKDVPCNILLQFLLREGKLDLMVYARSNDLILGWPYDTFHWTLLQELVASVLGVELGHYYTTWGSLHLYERDFSLAEKIVATQAKSIAMEPVPEVKDLCILLSSLSKAEDNLRTNRTMPQVMQKWWYEWFIILARKLGLNMDEQLFLLQEALKQYV